MKCFHPNHLVLESPTGGFSGIHNSMPLAGQPQWV